jgi:parvulin-like peptidyl-prolyl isomerase
MAMLMGRWIAGAAVAFSLCVTGCGVVGPRSTNPIDFYSSPAPIAGDVRSANDQGGGLVYSGGQVGPWPAPSSPVSHRDDTISATVQQASTRQAEVGSTPTGVPAPTTGPAAAGPVTQPSDVAIVGNTSNGGATTAPDGVIGPGQYMVIGAVVANVNTTPIYANKVVAFLEPILRNLAREDDPDEFRTAAATLIRDEVQRQINDELLYTAAMQNLNDEQKSRARGLTTEWYERQVTDAGGSVELARQRAAASGVSLDEQTQQMYRLLTTQIYRQYTLIPRIQVTAQMMRDYYAEHKQDQFTTSDHADFYLIEIDPEKSAGDTQQAKQANALERVQHIRNRVAAGESFRALAASNNDNLDFKARANTSKPFSFLRNSFAIDEVDAAVFSLQPGQTSDIIPARGEYYLAEVEARTVEKVLPFDDQAVQDQIERKMRGEQFDALQKEQTAKLISEAAVTRYDDMYEATLQMVMQNYPVWRGK